MTCKAAPAEPLQEPTDANTSEPAHPHVPDLDKILPAKPKDWDIRDPVTAEQQQPAKKRGRKPKAKDTEPDGTHGKTEKQRSRKKTTVTEESKTDVKTPSSNKSRKRPASKSSTAEASKPKGRGRKAACKKEEESTSKYVPLGLEGDINLDKGVGFDAYALSCAAADAHALEGPSSSNAGDKDEEPTTRSKRSKCSKRSKRGKCKGKSTAPKNNKKAPRRKKEQEPTDKPAKTHKPAPKRREKTPEEKAKHCRKSCAYSKVLRAQKKAGVPEEVARKAASEVTQPNTVVFLFSF